MTEEKKKAIELYKRFHNETFSHWNIDECNHFAKLSSLICIDEVISACEYNMVESHNTDWWNRVKDELNNL